MVTLLRVLTRVGEVSQCDATCHNSSSYTCRCCCGGRYHGRHEGTARFELYVLEHQEQVLFDLGLLEQAGQVWILAYRVTPSGRLHRRPKNRPRAYQDTLPGLTE